MDEVQTVTQSIMEKGSGEWRQDIIQCIYYYRYYEFDRIVNSYESVYNGLLLFAFRDFVSLGNGFRQCRVLNN